MLLLFQTKPINSVEKLTRRHKNVWLPWHPTHNGCRDIQADKSSLQFYVAQKNVWKMPSQGLSGSTMPPYPDHTLCSSVWYSVYAVSALYLFLQSVFLSLCIMVIMNTVMHTVYYKLHTAWNHHLMKSFSYSRITLYKGYLLQAMSTEQNRHQAYNWQPIFMHLTQVF